MKRAVTLRTAPASGRIGFANGGWLCVEPLWTEDVASKAVTAEDVRRAAQFSSPCRRQEFLTWRAMLYRELGRTVQIEYNSAGAPYLTDFQGYIGVSHSRWQAAVCWSPAEPCAVDIESADRDFTKVLRRYLSQKETSAHAEWPCIAWCAKECLYKLAGEQGLDLLDDLRIVDAPIEKDSESGTLAGTVKGRHYDLRFARFGPDWAVWKE